MHKGFLGLACIALLSSCGGPIEKMGYRTLPKGQWHSDHELEFAFSGMDTVQGHHIFINLRNNAHYPYSNLFLIARLRYPNGDLVTDTLEYEMALPDGQWLGKGYGSIKENKFWYKENIVFRDTGVYTLRLAQAMRKNGRVEGIAKLEGVTDVGFEIVKHNQ